MITALFLAALSCPPAQTIDLDLDKWRAQTKRVKGNAAIKAHAAKVGIRLEALDDGKFRFSSVDTFEAKLTDSVTPDRVIQLYYRHYGHQERELEGCEMRLAVLQPLAPDRWCLAGTLGRARADYEHPCDGVPYSPLPLVVHFTPLLHPDRVVMRVTTMGGACYGAERSSAISTAFHAIVDGRLEKIFSAILYDASYVSPTPPTSSITGTVIYGKGSPKPITLVTEYACHDDDFEEK